MRNFIIENYSLFTIILLLTVTFLLWFLKSYISELGKSKALKAENGKLVEETEKIKSHYTKELEELKKEHQLDIAKRTYQYESKKEQYITYFKLLDEFANQNSNQVGEKFLPIIEEFNRNFLRANSSNNKKNETNATFVFQKKIQGLLFESNKDLMKIKQESNTIRLIASDEVLKKIGLLDFMYDKLLEESGNVLNSLSNKVILGDSESLKEDERKLKHTGNLIEHLKKQIIELMRKELNEI